MFSLYPQCPEQARWWGARSPDICQNEGGALQHFCLHCCHHSADESQLLTAAGVTFYQPSLPSAAMSLQVCGSKTQYPLCLCHSKRPGAQRPSTQPSHSQHTSHCSLILHKALQAIVKPQDLSEHQSTNKWGHG